MHHLSPWHSLLLLQLCSSHAVTRVRKEFIRIGYYVNVDYNDEAMRADPPSTPQIALLYRTVVIDHPRVTRFPNDFDNEALPEAAESALEPASPVDEQQAAAQPMVF